MAKAKCAVFLLFTASLIAHPAVYSETRLRTAGHARFGYDDGTAIIPRKARGYGLSRGELQTPVYFDPRIAWSAGALYSTVRDLTLWSEALGHGTLLNADSTDRMFRIYPETIGRDNYKMAAYYGFGLVLVASS
jgi:hypothetical protein